MYYVGPNKKKRKKKVTPSQHPATSRHSSQNAGRTTLSQAEQRKWVCTWWGLATLYIYSHARLDRVTEGDSEVPRSLLTLCACDVFRALINSLLCLLTELLLDRQGQTRASAAYRVERSEGQSYTTKGKLIVTPSSLCNWTRFVVSFAQCHAWKTCYC